MQCTTTYAKALTHPASISAAPRQNSRKAQTWPASKQQNTSLCYLYRMCSMSDQTLGSAPLVHIIMGVSGCGKSTVGAMLADRLHCPFYDADNYHPAANIRKMSAGIPLTDEDRWPWLQRLADLIRQHVKESSPAVLACSALKPAYRQALRAAALPDEHQPAAKDAAVAAATSTETQTDSDAAQGWKQPCDDDAQAVSQLVQQQQQSQLPIAFVLLNPSKEQLLLRVQQRAAGGKHFMPPSLLEDQLQQLSYDPAELYMCFGWDAQHGGNSTSLAPSGSGRRCDSECKDEAQANALGASGLNGRSGSHMQADPPDAQQIVNAILHQAKLQ